MSQQEYYDMVAEIADSFKEDGFAMTLTQTIEGVLNPVTGKREGEAATDYTVYGIKGSLGSVTVWSSNTTKMGTAIEAGDALYTIEAGQVVPDANDILTVLGVKWRVLAAETVAPGGVDLLYKLHVRR